VKLNGHIVIVIRANPRPHDDVEVEYGRGRCTWVDILAEVDLSGRGRRGEVKRLHSRRGLVATEADLDFHAVESHGKPPLVDSLRIVAAKLRAHGGPRNAQNKAEIDRVRRQLAAELPSRGLSASKPNRAYQYIYSDIARQVWLLTDDDDEYLSPTTSQLVEDDASSAQIVWALGGRVGPDPGARTCRCHESSGAAA
jgi:hypothetical protein